MSALIIVDMQNDFMPIGALPVPGADKIVPTVNVLSEKFPLVLASKDWHPPDHMSFAVNHPGRKAGDTIEVQGISQILWPVHCVRNTEGAEFVDGLVTDKISCVFFKGTDKWIDSYSTFFDNARKRSTGLADYLKSRGVREIYLAGVALDYCVLYSALDAVELGFKTFVIYDATRAINLQEKDEELALAAMSAKGAQIITSDEVPF
jgi:nicotinamidase/pyrazinamidase